MLVPTMYDLSEVTAESRYKEESVFDLGITGEIVFLVVVPELGACRVPDVALSHFMAGADEYSVEAMPEYYSGALSGRWTIKRDRLRILADSWEKYSSKCRALADSFAAPAGKVEETGTRMNENRAFLRACIKDGIAPDIESIWLHIRAKAGTDAFLFKSASKGSATTVDGKTVQKKNLARVLRDLPDMPKNG